MKRQVIFRRLAKSDMESAIEWYNSKRNGLGNQLLLAIEACLERVATDPERFPLIYKRLRKARVTRFPYQVLYLFDNDSVIVVAIFHAKRDPEAFIIRV